MKKTTVYLDESILASVKAIAQRESRSEANVIRESLSKYVDQRSRRLPSFVGIVSDDSFSAEDDEAYLQKHWKAAW